MTEGYVPPELLLGAQSYGPEVDIWVRQIQTHARTTYLILYAMSDGLSLITAVVLLLRELVASSRS